MLGSTVSESASSKARLLGDPPAQPSGDVVDVEVAVEVDLPLRSDDGVVGDGEAFFGGGGTASPSSRPTSGTDSACEGTGRGVRLSNAVLVVVWSLRSQAF